VKAALLGLLLAGASLAAAPQLVSSTPAQGQDSVLPTAPLKLVFSQPMDLSSLNAVNAFTLYDLTDGGGGSAGAYITLSADGLTATFVADYFRLRAGVAYRFDLNASVIKDRSGNPLVPTLPIFFNTFLHPSKTAPGLVGTVPANGETGVATNTGIYLVFDEPIANLTDDAGIALTGGAGPLAFTSTVAGDRILQIKTALLFPANQSISVTISGIYDRNGNKIAAPLAFSFQTGTLPDVQLQTLTLMPPQGFPVSLPVHLTFSKPLDAPLVTAGSALFQSTFNYRTGEIYPAAIALSGDRRTLSVSAVPALPPGSYTLQVSIPFDRTQGKLGAFGGPISIGASADPVPAQLLAASPPDGSSVPATAVIRLAFTKPVDFAGALGAVSLSAGADPVPGKLSVDNTGTVVTFVPLAQLQPSITYTLSATGLFDFAGNPLAPYSGAFTTFASGTFAGAFTVVSSAPANLATGVGPLSPIQIAFSHPVDPVSLQQGIGITDSNNATVTGAFAVNGAVVTFQPAAPMPGGSIAVNLYSVRDLGGAVAAAFRASFAVENSQSDTTPPVVVSVSPGNGGTVLYTAAHVELEFSKPMNPSTLTAFSPGIVGRAGNFSAYIDGVTPVSLVVSNSSSTRAALEFTAPPGVTVTIVGSAAIMDDAGNSLVPFRTTLQTSIKPANGAAHVIRQFPDYESTIFPAGSRVNPITTIWSAPLNQDSVNQNVLVYTSNGPVAGSIQWTADSTAFAFIPAAPYPDTTTVYFSLLPPARDAAGLPITYFTSFNSGYHNTTSNPGALAFVGSNFPVYPALPPLNFKLEVQFNQDLTEGVLATVKATFGKYQAAMQSIPFVHKSPRVLLFTPPFPLEADTGYTLLLAVGSLTSNNSFTTGSGFASANPTLSAAGPVGSNVPQNSGVGVLFSEPVSTLLTDGGGVTLETGGVSVPLNSAWTSPQSISLQPDSFLKPNTTYTVTVSGFENLAANSVPSRTWTFQTGSSVDTTAPTLLRTHPSGAGIDRGAVVSFSFDKAISPAASFNAFSLMIASNGFTSRVPAILAFSDDLMTAYLRPNPVLAAGATYTAAANTVQDFAGNSTANTPGIPAGSTFQVGYTPAAPAAITASNPPANATGVPLNAAIQVGSSSNLFLVGGLSATLLENGNPLNATLQISADGLTLKVIPARPLSANSQIGLTVSGIGAAPYAFTFSTGTDPDQTAPVATAFPVSGMYPVPASVVMHIRFNKPLNPLSVNTGSVTLRTSNNSLLDAAVILDGSGRMVSITPKLPLPGGVMYGLQWSVTDWAGNVVTGGSSFTVGPKDDVPATLFGIDPADGSTEVDTTPLMQALFNQPVEFTLGDGSFVLLLNNVPVPGRPTVQGNGISFSPSHSLQPGITYSLKLRGAVDAFGTALPDATSTFTTAAAGDSIAPLKLVSTMPVNGAVGVPADAPVRLSFNHPVTLASALTLVPTYAGTLIPSVSVRLDGNDVVLQPLAPFTSSSAFSNLIGFSGTVRDNTGYFLGVRLSFTLAPIQDTTAPVLEYSFPAAGSTIPATGANVYLRFSKPVQVAANAIRVIGGTVQNWYVAEDGRTIASTSASFSPDSDITIAISSGVTDFAGNPIVPVSFQVHALSTALSDAPKVGSTTPSAGAINVPVDAAIQFQFTHPMDPTSVTVGLHVTADGSVVTGDTTVSHDGATFTFQPGAHFSKGAVVNVVVGATAEDLAGQEAGAFNWSSTVIKDSILPAVIGISATAAAVDIRFDAPLEHYRLAPYIRSGFNLIPSHWEVRGSDWLRIVPDESLLQGRDYRLVLDGRTEFPLRTVGDGAAAAIAGVVYDGRTLHLRFDREIGLQTVGLTTPDGTPVAYAVDRAIDGRELRLRLKSAQRDLVLTIDGQARQITLPAAGILNAR
jgi:methionine-rich copper-binding protein CopC